MFVCWFSRRELTALADGELSARRAARVRAHLAGCAQCAALAGDLEEVAGDWADARPAEPALDVERLYRGVLRRLKDEPERAARRWLVPLPVAGALAAAAVVLVLMGRTPPAPPPAETRAAVAEEPAAVPAVAARPRKQVPAPVVARAENAPAPVAEQPAGAAAVEDPLDGLPVEVLARPELFHHYRLFEKLEAIEHFESVRNESLDGTPEQPQG